MTKTDNFCRKSVSPSEHLLASSQQMFVFDNPTSTTTATATTTTAATTTAAATRATAVTRRNK